MHILHSQPKNGGRTCYGELRVFWTSSPLQAFFRFVVLFTDLSRLYFSLSSLLEIIISLIPEILEEILDKKLTPLQSSLNF